MILIKKTLDTSEQWGSTHKKWLVGLVVFYGISTLVGYLILNPVYTLLWCWQKERHREQQKGW